MPLSPGTRLGHYDVTALIGEAGMGQVWQATDTARKKCALAFIMTNPGADSTLTDRLGR